MVSQETSQWIGWLERFEPYEDLLARALRLFYCSSSRGKGFFARRVLSEKNMVASAAAAPSLVVSEVAVNAPPGLLPPSAYLISGDTDSEDTAGTEPMSDGGEASEPFAPSQGALPP